MHFASVFYFCVRACLTRNEILHQQNLQLRELLSKYESSGSFAGEPLSSYPQDNLYGTGGVDYSNQYEAYQASQRGQQLPTLDYANISPADGVSLLPDSKPQQYMAQPQMPSYGRLSGPSFEVDERYQVGTPEGSYAVAHNSNQAYAGVHPGYAHPVSLDGTR